MNIKEIRTKLKLTQKDFANLIGKSVASLKTTNPEKPSRVKTSWLRSVNWRM